MPATATAKLPSILTPMLATSAKPFDSDDYAYEIKWDGFRALAFVENDALRIVGRRQTDYTKRFSELSPLSRLPNGTLLDGEVVALTQGKPDFTALLKSRSTRTTYVAFDLLYDRFRWAGDLPIEQRQANLSKLLTPHLSARVAVSTGIVGQGLALLEQARKLNLEGIIAKKLGSPYEPGRRTRNWLKFKEQQHAAAAIIGYELNPDGNLRSLILATEADGRLHFAGQVGSGIKPTQSAAILATLSRYGRADPPISVPLRGRRYRWLEPVVQGQLSYLERLPSGAFRAPVLRGISDIDVKKSTV